VKLKTVKPIGPTYNGNTFIKENQERKSTALLCRVVTVVNLTTLEKRAERADMLQVYKIVMGIKGLRELKSRIYLRKMKEGGIP